MGRACLQCTELNPCSACLPGSYVSSTGICLACTGQCPPCAAGEMPRAGSCVPCPTHCRQCSAEGCLECSAGYTLQEEACYPSAVCVPPQTFWKGQCSAGCQSPHVEHEGFCLSACPRGYYKLDLSCALCDPSCLTCDSEGPARCLTCPAPKVLERGSCLDTCLQCTGCPPRQVWSDSLGRCEDCGDYCLECSSSTQCLNCKVPYEVRAGICILEPNCQPGTFFSDDYECESCGTLCTSCLVASSCL